MNAYDSVRYQDLMERQQVRNEVLTAKERALLNRLNAQARQEWENKPTPCLYGGDMLDVF